MKRRALILGSLALSASLLLSACGGSAASSQAASASSEAVASSAAASSEASGESVQLTVFAAASLTETLNEISEQYKTVAPNVELVFNFDSSGTLKTQIEEGADCDLFLSAAQKQMNALQDEDLINTGTRVDLLENKVVLAVPEGNPARTTPPTSRALRTSAPISASGSLWATRMCPWAATLLRS